jgi:hypothetical protein
LIVRTNSEYGGVDTISPTRSLALKLGDFGKTCSGGDDGHDVIGGEGLA